MSKNIDADDKLLEQIGIQDLIIYLEHAGWSKQTSKYADLIVYEKIIGPEKISGRIVLASSDVFDDAKETIALAINRLSKFIQSEPTALATHILSQNFDSLQLKVSHDVIRNGTMSIDYALNWLKDIKNLLAYSAGMEMSPVPVPHFARVPMSGLLFAHRCLIGQTFQGSYGVSIQAPMPHGQLSLTNTPLERRSVMRLRKGFELALAAVKQDDVQILVDNFETGFNANMCQEVLKLFEQAKYPIFDIQIFWATTWGAPVGFEESAAFRLDYSICNYLDKAARILAEDPLEEVTIIGRIMSWKGAPNKLYEAIEHSISIRGEDTAGRELTARFTITDAEFQTVRGYLSDVLMTISGSLYRVGNNFYLIDTFNFKPLAE
jgi:hypothetical protein